MTKAKSVSLVVVNYDRIVSLALLLKNLEYQRYPNFEIIVVSNLSEEQRPRTDLPVRWIPFLERNISAARNVGIAAAGGEIIAFCDDDAVPEYGWLDALIPAFENDRVASAGGFVRGRNGVAFQWKCAMLNSFAQDRRLAVNESEITFFPPDPKHCLKTVGTNCAFLRRALVDVGGFDEAFHFYLDEADVNFRLSLAGWSAAIVPYAEIHHGYAEGPYRNKHRVPKTLFEIGASEAYFIKKHGPGLGIESHLDGFAAHQKKRLGWFFHQGLLTEQRMYNLLETLRKGFSAGLERREKLLTSAPAGKLFVPCPSSRKRQAPLLLVAKPYQRRSALRSKATEAAAEGREVTLIEPEYSHRNLNVRYTIEGFWLHRFGVAGFAERQAPRPLQPIGQRIKTEINRVALQRGLNCDAV